jgi:predicted amidohydrolase YtcJ
MMRLTLTVALLTSVTLGGCGFRGNHADVVLHNGVVLTLDAASHEAQAIAVRSGRVVEVGPERAILNKYHADTEIDLMGAVVVPGLMDAHAHVVGFADGLGAADLVGTTSADEVLDKVLAHAALFPDGWVIGRGWDQNDWEETQFPNRADRLDRLFPDRPVILERVDGHAVWCNAVALERAGMVPGLHIEGGELLVAEDGQLTGVLVDGAADSLQAWVPEPDSVLRAGYFKEAARRLAAVGLTHITDAGLEPQDVEAIAALQASGELPLRFAVMVADRPEALDHYLSQGPIIDSAGMLDVRAVKFYMDGSLGSRGASLLEPYSDRTETQGLFLQDESDYIEKVKRVQAAGFQVATHCIGDAAVRRVLGIYGDLLGGVNDFRWRIEHAQVVHRDDLEAFAAHTIIPSIQPTHATSDMYWAGQRLGRNRVRRAYIYKSLQSQLGWLPLGTDFPVEGIAPLRTFYAAVERKDVEGYPEGGFQSEEALDRMSALKGMTSWAALACFREHDLGQIAPGYRADFTVLDRNPLTVPSSALLETRVLQTWIEGKRIFERQAR